MKKHILTVSLAANLLALLLIGILGKRSQPVQLVSANPPPPPRTVYVTNILAAAELPILRLDPRNLGTFIQEAKSRGLSDAQIRTLARAELLAPPEQRQFWQRHCFTDELKDAASLQAAAVAVSSALATAGLPDEDPLAFVGEKLTREHLRAALAPSELKRQELEVRNAGGAWSQDDSVAYQKAFDQMAAAAKQILTPDELLDWEVRQGLPIAERLQHLPGFDFTGPEEFKTAYGIEKVFEQKRDASSDVSASATERKAQLLALFGEARMQDYDRSFDPSFATEVDLAHRYGLPSDYAAWLYQLREQFQGYERQLQEQSALTDDERRAEMTALRNKCRATVAQHLPQPAVDAYYDSGGYWLKP